MKTKSYALQMNQTHLLLIPSLGHVHNPSSTGTVVQVGLRSDDGEGYTSNTFLAEQSSVTRTIETLLVGHVNALHRLPKCVVVREAAFGYSLVGIKKPWKYGRGKQFFLGDVMLQPAEEKWIFHFKVDPD